MSAKNPKCPICHNEYFIVKDLLFTGMGPQGVPLGSKVYIPKCSNCGYHSNFRNIWRVEDELELYPSLSEAIDRAKEILKKKNIMKISFYKIRAKYRTENVENDVVEGYEVYSTSIDDEDTIACFFSSEIYGTEEAYKKASEAQEELSSWQYKRR